MGILSNPLSPLAPYASALKLGAIALAGLALIGLAWSWHSRGQEIERLETLQTTIVNAATVATVEPDEDGRRKPLQPEAVPAAIQSLSNSLQSAETTLRSISAGAMTAKAASDAADKVLAEDIDRMQDHQFDPNGWNPWGE